VCVARFVARKRHVDLVRALDRLENEGVGFRAVFVGYGPTLDPIRELSRKAGLQNVVEFRGRLAPDEIQQLLTQSDIFCLPSLWEGTVISVMEAMATGLPVVATDVNGVNEVVIDGVTGLLVPPYSHDRLAEALRTLLSDPTLRRRMGTAGRRRVQDAFRLDAVVGAKEALYRSLVGRRAETD
jgi:glycosyltransferase involved in cell wall biosynthesis